MIVLSLDTLIDGPPEAVFEVFADPVNHPRWNPVLQSAEWTSSDPPGIGSSFRGENKVFGSTKEALARISAWDPPRSYGFTLKTPLPPVDRLAAIFTLEPENSGTRVSQTTQVEYVAALRFLERPGAEWGRQQDRENLARAQRILGAR